MSKTEEKVQESLIRRENGETIFNLVHALRYVWGSRKVILIVLSVFIAMGLFVAIFSKKEFSTSVTFIPQTSSGGIGSSLGGLAAIAGIRVGDIGSSTDIPYTIYPQIVNSLSFQKKLLHTRLLFSGYDEELSFYEYYKNVHDPGMLGLVQDYTIGLPGLILTGIRGEAKPAESGKALDTGSLQSVSQEEYELIKMLRESLSINVNQFDGYVRISASMPDPVAAADLVRKAQIELQETIILLKSGKAKEKLDFIEERFLEKQKTYLMLQDSLAKVQDNNLILTTQKSKLTLTRLRSEYDVALQIYTELATQLESQKIQVKEDTPIFLTVEQASIPIEKSKPRRFTILILWTFFGFFFAVASVLFRPLFSNFKNYIFGSNT